MHKQHAIALNFLKEATTKSKRGAINVISKRRATEEEFSERVTLEVQEMGI